MPRKCHLKSNPRKGHRSIQGGISPSYIQDPIQVKKSSYPHVKLKGRMSRTHIQNPKNIQGHPWIQHRLYKLEVFGNYTPDSGTDSYKGSSGRDGYEKGIEV